MKKTVIKNKKIVAAAGVVLICTLAFPIMCQAVQESTEKKSISSMVETFMESSSSAESAELSDARKKLGAYEVENKLAQLEGQIESNENSIRQYQHLKYSSGKSEERSKYQQSEDYQRVYGYELKMSQKSYTMQKKLNELYEEYSEQITEQQDKKLEYEAYQMLWNISVYEKQYRYLAENEKLKALELKIKRDSLKIGYATEGEIIACEAALDRAKADTAACKSSLEMLRLEYTQNTDTDAAGYSTDFTECEAYKADEVLKAYEEKSFYPEYYRRQAEAYTEYADSLDELIKDMNENKLEEQNRDYGVTEENSEYYERVHSYLSAEAEYYRNEIEILENTASSYEDARELYVHRVCSDINTLIAEHRANQSELKSAETQYKISQELLKSGRINEAALIEAKCLVYKLSSELTQTEAEIMYSRFILDNLIENFS